MEIKKDSFLFTSTKFKAIQQTLNNADYYLPLDYHDNRSIDRVNLYQDLEDTKIYHTAKVLQHG